MYESFIDAAEKFLDKDRLLIDEPMSRHTTFRVGGTADIFMLPGTAEELKSALFLARQYDVPMTIIGNGSNLLVRDGGIRGAVLSFGAPFSYVRRGGESLVVGAGTLLSAVSKAAEAASLSGLEFAVGIPGSTGGAVFMNAGAYGGEIKDVVTRVMVITKDGETESRTPEEIGFGYRQSAFQENGEIIYEAELSLRADDREKIRSKMNALTARRLEKQPLDKPSAGSTFKRPAGHFAGTLIDEAGLKGLTVGGAMVSEKHAGFIINRDNATARDILSLIEEVRRRVYEKSGVTLTPEVRILGEEP